MSTLRVNQIQDAAGSGSPAINGLAKAWVNFNGTGTVAIRAAFNVSSISDNGTGDFTVNFTTAMSDANYSITGSGGEGGTTGMGQRTPSIGTVSTGSVRMASINQDATYVDPVVCCISVFR
jgi:hypothetical protein